MATETENDAKVPSSAYDASDILDLEFVKRKTVISVKRKTHALALLQGTWCSSFVGQKVVLSISPCRVHVDIYLYISPWQRATCTIVFVLSLFFFLSKYKMSETNELEISLFLITSAEEKNKEQELNNCNIDFRNIRGVTVNFLEWHYLISQKTIYVEMSHSPFYFLH